MADELDALFEAIRARLEQLGPQAHRRESPRTLARDGRPTRPTIRSPASCPFQSVFTSPSQSVIRTAECGSSSSMAIPKRARLAGPTCSAPRWPSIGVSLRRPSNPAMEGFSRAHERLPSTRRLEWSADRKMSAWSNRGGSGDHVEKGGPRWLQKRSWLRRRITRLRSTS